MEVNIIGAGLAGCELAYQLAQKGIKVNLYEKKNIEKNEIQKLDTFAELVCSNTFRSKSTQNAVGILKKELEQLDSFILKCAYLTEIPSDDALAVDRISFSKLVDKKIREQKNITVFNEELKILDADKIYVICCGPLISDEFKKEIDRVVGNQKLFYLDASSPIIKKDSIDFKKVYYSSRHSNDNSYICAPLNKHEFENFYINLINAQKVKLKDFEKEIFFKGCQPIEQIAIQSKKNLINGPMSPNGLEHENNKPYAVIQLRKDNAIDSLYNIVGFQTNLTWPEQKRVFQLIPGLENAEFARYGVMHKNSYINSPKILNKKLQVMRNKKVYFAGQVTGVEGYIESFASAFIVFFALYSEFKNKKFIPFPDQTILGALTNYITNKKLKKLKPMKANMGIVKVDKEFDTKTEKYDYIYENSMLIIKNYLEKIF
ncbi:methylenetetrahydrofolate--tRNA-(uracil(54)-C(5))-methyltransferase (FADH(2)-oxidizing) TrmFO [Spiroplasma tabanidicola]|uniref:Methylenetetrahydrofolate--tRNA-(uracil-5-)-methyltransferase TrmFO n=1 Tax=Spiroplasma tabanidicola TaxID=324079 RepID=A0A6I6CE02_9MOLU|nr:methylenetetrahydrofolate--tRNA-(uracil(54)-C(5))-methyltransferase (FADH(2)-oxidizing) TrmFO [Spiroplasma tabanidicola]QGS52204.1 tRNA (uracil-5-)-methyltransferase Gid [Spiroplasma tabanidicola]